MSARSWSSPSAEVKRHPEVRWLVGRALGAPATLLLARHVAAVPKPRR